MTAGLPSGRIAKLTTQVKRPSSQTRAVPGGSANEPTLFTYQPLDYIYLPIAVLPPSFMNCVMELAYSLLEMLPQAFVLYHPLTDQQGRLTDFTTRYANQALQTIVPGRDQPGQTQTLFQRHPFTRPHLDSFNALLTSRQEFRLDYEAPHRSRWYAMSFQYLEGDMLCRYDDITEQRLPGSGAHNLNDERTQRLHHPTVGLVETLQATNQQLRQQQGLLEGILNGSQNGLLSCAPIYNETNQVVDLRIELVNPAASLINGLTIEHLVGKTLLTAFPALAGSPLMASYLHTAQTGQLQRLEAHYQDANLNGWFEVVVSPLPQQHVLISFLDITDRHQAEAAHLHQASLMQRISESGHIGIMTHRPIGVETGHIHDFAITYVNEQAQRWLGVDLRQVTRQRVRSLVGGEDGEELVRQMARVIQTGASARREITLPDGRVLFWAISPLETGCVTTFMDVTQQRRAQQRVHYQTELEQQVIERTQALVETLRALEESREELQRALATERELGEIKSRFVSMASHEFRTPLTAVLSSVALIEKYPGADQQDKRQKHTQRIRLAVKQLTDILEEFLSIDRLDEGQLKVQAVEVNLPQLVSEAIADLQDTLKPHQTIRTDLACEGPIGLDESLLRKILINLLSNAIKYSGPGSVVSIQGECGQNWCTLRVQDQGIGIAEQDQIHLFERFYRASNVTNIAGTGLGLHIVRRYVELLGGQLSLQSELNKGTIITLLLPYQGIN
jgi:PAS domain S-box-containing protein